MCGELPATIKRRSLCIICVIISQILVIYVIFNIQFSSSIIRRSISVLPGYIFFHRNISSEKEKTYTEGYKLPSTSHTWLPEYEKPLCIGKRFDWQAEDLFCLERPQYLENYKNPCFNDTGRIRCLPYFHLLGADKCGSTDLFDRILQHPEMERCWCALGKESYYWCWKRHGVWMKTWNNSDKEDFQQYIRRFDPPTKYITGNVTDGYHSHITGDGTPMDFWDFRGWTTIPQNEGLDEPKVLTPHLMRHVYTHPKFIIILRNPTERLYSDYFFLGYGWSADTFHDHAVQAVRMVEDCLKVKSVRQCFYSPEFYRDLPMRIHIGCYAVFLQEWLAVFPRNQFHILRNEDYHVKNKEHLTEVFRYLGLRELSDDHMTEISERKMRHVTARKQAAGPMRNDTWKLLNQFYSSYNRQLADMLQDKRFLWEDSIN